MLVMLELIRIFWAICRLKAAPQELPKRHSILVLAVFSGIIVDCFASSILLPKYTGFEIISTVFIFNVVLLSAVYLLLKFIGYAERGVQTLTAIAGSGFFISLVLFPALLMLDAADDAVKSFVFLILFDNVWRLVVNAQIFRHALSINLVLATVISISYLLFGVLVSEYLLPSQLP
jgi:hypothetical protein